MPQVLEQGNKVVVQADSGYVVTYQTKPRKSWVDDELVPSVTQVLNCLDKPGLPWWGQGIGVQAILELVNRGLLLWQE